MVEGLGGGQVLVSGVGEVCVGGHPAGERVRVNGLVCGSMCDPPSGRQSALAHMWMSLHVGTRGSRVQGRMKKKALAGGAEEVSGPGSAARFLRLFSCSGPLFLHL